MLALRHRAETLAAALPPLLLRAERIAQSVWHGAHARRRTGIGETFWQYRPYDSSDPADRIDWRQSARTDKLFVRLREMETVQTACLWADVSGSMDYASEKNLPTKADQAQILMLALASLLLRGGEKVQWSEGSVFHPVNGSAGLEKIASAAGNGALPHPPRLRHAHAVLASDFLMPVELLREQMLAYAGQHIKGTILHIVDPLEISFALDGRVELHGAENENSFLVPNAAAMRDAYRERFAKHEATLRDLAQSAGWLYLRHVTSEPASVTLLKLYTYLSE
jgi:uncharacterized protein (DUF58 family)